MKNWIKFPIQKVVPYFLPLAVLFGCSTANPALDTARLLSAHTSIVQKEGEKFSNYLENSAKGRQKLVLRLKKNTIDSEFSNNETKIGWKTDKETVRLGLLKTVLDATQRAVENKNAFAQLEANMKKSIEATKSKTNFQVEELNKSAKALAQLGEEPDFEDQIDFFESFFKDVKESIGEANKTAKNQSKEAEKKASKAGEKNPNEDK